MLTKITPIALLFLLSGCASPPAETAAEDACMAGAEPALGNGLTVAKIQLGEYEHRADEVAWDKIKMTYYYGNQPWMDMDRLSERCYIFESPLNAKITMSGLEEDGACYFGGGGSTTPTKTLQEVEVLFSVRCH